jgi:hypothetical protein
MPMPSADRHSAIRTAIVLSSALTLSATAASAQMIQATRPSWTDQWTFGLAFMGGRPVGEFRNEENGGFGGEFTLGFQPFRRQPLILRGSVGGMQYHAVKARGSQENCDETGCWLEEVEYNARSHNMWYAYAGPEITAIDGAWRPFAFAMVGRSLFRSQANFKPTSPGGQEFSQTLFSSNNFSTSYGGGIRTMVSMTGREIGLEFSARVNRNIDAEYLTERGVVENPDGSFTITPRRGQANVLGIYLGLWVGPRVLWNER